MLQDPETKIDMDTDYSICLKKTNRINRGKNPNQYIINYDWESAKSASIPLLDFKLGATFPRMSSKYFGSHIYKEAVFANSLYGRSIEHTWFDGYTSFFNKITYNVAFLKNWTKNGVKPTQKLKKTHDLLTK